MCGGGSGEERDGWESADGGCGRWVLRCGGCGGCGLGGLGCGGFRAYLGGRVGRGGAIE